MAGIEPVESGDGGVSIWVVAGVAIAVVGLLGFAAWFAIVTVTDGEAGAGSEQAAESWPSSPTTLLGHPTIGGVFVIESDFGSATAVLFMPGGTLTNGTPCAGIDSDIEPGVTMRVSDGNGTMLGTGQVGAGRLALVRNVDDYTVPAGSSSDREDYVYAVSNCVHEFSIPLSAESEAYTVTVGNLGGLGYSRSETYSHKELSSFGWFLELAP